MLKTGMDRFSFPDCARATCVDSPRGGLTLLAALTWLAVSGLTNPVSAAAAHDAPALGLIVQLRPGAVPDDLVSAQAIPRAREGTLSAREQAQSAWQHQHTNKTAHLATVAAAAGVPALRLGSAGSGLRLDFAHPQTGEVLQASMRRLRLHPDVLSVTPNVRMRRMQAAGGVTPNDPQFAQQWHLQASSTYAGAINMPSAWARSTGFGKATVIAVVDNGARYDHPDLAGRLLPGFDFVSEVDYSNDGDGRDADATDPGDWVSVADTRTPAFQGCDIEDSSWHGTAIAGEIAAVSNNSVGVSGIHWGGVVLPVRVASKCGAVLSDLLDGMRWAAGLPVVGVPANPNPARVISLSFGGSGACDSAYQQTVTDVTAAGALVVVAAGNSSSSLTRPADCQGVLTVVGVRGDGAKAGYSSFGSNAGISAPGGSGVTGTDVGILTTLDSGRAGPVGPTYSALAGTSFAAPLVAGVAGLMLSVQPSLSTAELMQKLKASVRPHTESSSLSQCGSNAFANQVCNCTLQTCGTGLLDANLALAAAAASSSVPTPTPTPAPSSDSSGNGGAAVVGGAALGGGGSFGGGWGGALWVWVLVLAGFRWKALRRPSS